MKALVYNPQAKDSSFLSSIEVDKPELNVDAAAIVRVRGCGVCGSDLLKLNRNLVKPGTILGHELVGEIFEISPELSKTYNLSIGDRIISSHHVPCLKCDYCINDQESLCKQFKNTNFKPGAFCEYLELSELHLKHTVHKIPEHLSDSEASFAEPIACCIKAIKRSGLLEHKGHSKVMIIGLGSIGQILGRLINHYRSQATVPKSETQISADHNASIIELNGCDLIEYKRKLAIANGFDNTTDKLENIDADYIFLASGVNPTVDLAIKNVKAGGTIIVFASVADENIGFSNNEIYFKELKLISSYSPNLIDLRESVDLLSKSQIQVKDLITHQSGIENLGKTIQQCLNEQGMKVFLRLISVDTKNL